MREICTSGSVGGEGGNTLAYLAPRRGPRLSSCRSKTTAPCPRVGATQDETSPCELLSDAWARRMRDLAVMRAQCPRLCPPYGRRLSTVAKAD